MTTLENLQETERRLAAALEDVRAKIARGGAPSDWCFSTDSDGYLWISLTGPDTRPSTNTIGISWNDNSARDEIFLDMGDDEYCCVEAAALFAWVDRVRELGETDL